MVDDTRQDQDLIPAALSQAGLDILSEKVAEQGFPRHSSNLTPRS